MKWKKDNMRLNTKNSPGYATRSNNGYNNGQGHNILKDQGSKITITLYSRKHSGSQFNWVHSSYYDYYLLQIFVKSIINCFILIGKISI